jgi:large subunit ribosomal protein L5
MAQRLKLFYLEKVLPELKTILENRSARPLDSQLGALPLQRFEETGATVRPEAIAGTGFASQLAGRERDGLPAPGNTARNKQPSINLQQIPKLEKIIINRGIGEASQNTKLVENSLDEITILSSQKAVVTKSKKAIAGFKIREGVPVGIVVTLRGERMYGFLDRLIHLALPRIRDFQGLNPKSFDGRGNYSLGLKEQLMFPEIIYEKVSQARGLDISIVTTAKNDDDGLALLTLLGMPFTNP